ncbi:MerR family transcriptional regulator [Actinomadura vinacea]|uniref:MerR family transcriptional regulator n=1 Tax=Actinomadura vinacea TaxID=115336 RepID=UPI0031D5C938
MSDDTIGIGELARLAGLPVRTVRFYCDEGVLQPRRSAGGHRRFDQAAVERLRLVRRLRALGLGLAAITRVLAGERALAEAVAAERAAVDAEMAALAWRRASLRAVEEAAPAERAARLDLLAVVERGGGAAYEAVREFWRELMVAPMPPRRLEDFVDGMVPVPPADPTPGQVVAYAELVVMAADRPLVRRLRERGKANAPHIADEAALLGGIAEACAMAAPDVRGGLDPRPGPALDRLVGAYAEARGGPDTPEFRRRLRTRILADDVPEVRRYWRLRGEVTGDPLTLGAVHEWLVKALAAPV